MKEAHAKPFLHPRHRLADRRRRHAELASRNGEISGFRGLKEGIQRSQTVHPRTSIADNQVRYGWNYGPFFRPSGELISGLCETAFCGKNTSVSPSESLLRLQTEIDQGDGHDFVRCFDNRWPQRHWARRRRRLRQEG